MSKIGQDLKPPVVPNDLGLISNQLGGSVQDLEKHIVIVPKPDQPPLKSDAPVQVEVPKILKENPGDQFLAESRARFPGISDEVLTGKTMYSEWTIPSLDLRTKIEPGLAQPGVAGVALGGLKGPEAQAALMPTAGVRGPNVNARIREKITEGEKLYQRVMSGDPPPNTKQNAALIMWYLQALASAKAGLSAGRPDQAAVFKEGALTIEDPGHRLESYLKSFNVYRRSSSHLDEYQKIPGCEPHGLDLRGVEMPNERRTLLMARLPSTQEAPDGPNLGDKPLLFLKMEPHGCRGLSVQGTGEKTGVWQGVKRFFANLKDLIGHAGGWATSVSQREGGLAIAGQNNRERIDKDLLAPYEKTLATLTTQIDRFAKPGPERNQDLAKILTAVRAVLDDPARSAKTGGVHLMLDKLRQAQILLRDTWRALDYVDPGIRLNVLNNGPLSLEKYGLAGLVSTPELKKGLMDMNLDKILTGARELLEGQGDHPELRFGREVILLSNEMKIGQCAELGQGFRQTMTGAGRMSERAQELTQVGYTYILNDLENQSANYLDQFAKDVRRGSYTVANRDYEQVEIGPDGQNEVGRAIDQLVKDAGNPPKVATALKCLAHQGFMAPLTDALSGHSLLATGYPLSTSSVDATTRYNLIREVSGNADETVYRLTGFFDTRLDHLTGTGKLASPINGTIMDYNRADSFVKGEMTVRLTFNRKLDTFTQLDIADSPSFEYRLTPAPPQ